MRKVRVSEYGKKADGSCVGASFTDTETGRDVICPLSGRSCTPDCAAYQVNQKGTDTFACCYWHDESNKAFVIGELVEEAKP